MAEISQSCVANQYQLMGTQGTGKKQPTELANLLIFKKWVDQLCCVVRVNFSAGGNVQMLLLVLEHLDRTGNKVSI